MAAKLNVVVMRAHEQGSAAQVVALILAANERFYPDDDEQLAAVLEEIATHLKVTEAAVIEKACALQSSVMMSEGTTDYRSAVLEARKRQGITVMPCNCFDDNGTPLAFAVWLAN